MDLSNALNEKIEQSTQATVGKLIKEAVDGSTQTIEGHRIFTPAHAQGKDHSKSMKDAASAAEKRGGKAGKDKTRRANGYAEGSAEAAAILKAAASPEDAHVKLANARDSRREKSEYYGGDVDHKTREQHRGAGTAIEDAASDLMSRTGVCGPAGYMGGPGGYYP
jgi:hypothetical protein